MLLIYYRLCLLIYYQLFTEKEERIQKEKEQGTYKEKVSEEQVFQNKSSLLSITVPTKDLKCPKE